MLRRWCAGPPPKLWEDNSRPRPCPACWQPVPTSTGWCGSAPPRRWPPCRANHWTLQPARHSTAPPMSSSPPCSRAPTITHRTTTWERITRSEVICSAPWNATAWRTDWIPAIPPLVNASVVYSQLGQNDRAEQSLRQALRLEPTNPAANLNLGMLLGELGRIAEAEQAFRTALQADPQSAAAAYNLGVILSQRDVSQAIELCRTADRLRPDEPKYAFAVASYLQQDGQIDQAIQELRQLQQRHPGFAYAYGLLGSLLVDRGRTAEAVQVYQQAAANSQLPDQARSFFRQQAQALSGSP